MDFATGWHRVGINFGTGGVELWIDGVRQGRSGDVMYRGVLFPCDTVPSELGLVGADNSFVAGALQIFRDPGSHLPLSRPYNDLDIDHLRLSSVRRDYGREIRP